VCTLKQQLSKERTEKDAILNELNIITEQNNYYKRLIDDL
jgi:hypothetical protein